MQPTLTPRPRLAVVIPVYGNQASLRELHERIDAATRDLGVELIYQFVNDRSPDESQGVLEQLAQEDPRVRVLLLSRNHGSFTAIMAGLEEVARLDVDAAAILAADLQDPPEKLPELIEAWRAGKQVVLGVRSKRSDSFVSKLLSQLYHAIYRRFVMAEMPQGGFDFCLIDRQVIEVINEASERNTSLIALIIWSGFERALVPYERAERKHGVSLWTLRKKLNYAVDSFVSFSTLPLRAFSVLGLALATLFFLGMLLTLFNYFTGRIHPEAYGWTSLMLTLLLIGAALVLGLGILGEYLLNTLQQSRSRPLFVVDRRIGGDPSPRSGAGDVPMFDLGRASAPVAASLREACERVLSSRQIVLGPEVARFERYLGAALDVPHVVGVNSGTDAITLGLWAAGVQPGDRVLTTALSAPPTAVAILRAGAIPVFVDVEPETLLIDPAQVAAVAAGATAIVPVHLYGNPCAVAALAALADEHGLAIVEDAAQSLGTTIDGRALGPTSRAVAYSFYPTKNLGGYGDGGAVGVRDAEAAERLRRMRMYGQDPSGECVEVGLNSRLDELQAALLTERLKVLDAHNAERRAIAARYDAALGFLRPVPSMPGRAPHLYVVRVAERDRFRAFLREAGVGSGVHYGRALNTHRYLAAQGEATACPVAEQAAREVVSLPCYPGLSAAEQDRVIEVCERWRERQEAK